MVAITIPSGDLKTISQVATGNGTFVVEEDAFVLTNAGNSVELLAVGGTWNVTVDGGVQANNGNGIKLTGVGSLVSKLTVGENGFVFGNGAGKSGFETDGAANIVNNGLIGGRLNAITINSPTAASFTISNAATGTIDGAVEAIKITGTIGGTQTITNAGLIDHGVSIQGLGAVVINNTGTFTQGEINTRLAGSTTIKNSSLIDSFVELGDGNNKITNSGTILRTVNLGAGNDTITNTGIFDDEVDLADGVNAVTNNGAMNSTVQTSGSQNTITNTKTMASVLSSGGLTKVTNSGTIDDLNDASESLTLTNTKTMSDVTLLGASSTVKNSGSIGFVTGAIGAVSITNTKLIDGNVDLFLTANVQLTNSGTITGAYLGSDAGADTITNSGVIEGGGRSLTLGDGVNVLKNSGTVNTAVEGGEGADTVNNSKTINGALVLGNGTNTVTNSGTISGGYTGGDGIDLVTNSGAGKFGDLIDLLGGNDTYVGGAGVDVVKAGDGQDSIKLGAGDDTFFAGDASDTLADTIDAGAGSNDLYDATGITGNMLINIDGNDHTDDFAGVTLIKNLSVVDGATDALDAITGFEHAIAGTGNDILFGNAASNRLEGGEGSDHLFGYGGNDVLFGGTEADVLIGGAGRDTLSGGGNDGSTDRFVFRSLADSGPRATTRDVITDFETFRDVIVMEEIDANTQLAGVQHNFTFIGLNQDFTGVAGQIRSLQIGNAAAGNLSTLVEADVNGDQKADFSIELTGSVILLQTSFDFVV